MSGCKYLAIIVENRFSVDGVIASHASNLSDEWKFMHIRDPKINSMDAYNNLLTSVDFYRNLPFGVDGNGWPDKLLIFQHDSALLREGIEEFLEWDYVGAPWMFQEHGGNGGLSIRNPKAMLACIQKQPWNPKLGNEDVYFSNLLKDMPEYKLAPREVCSKFSCESIFQLGTLGYHAIDKYLTVEEVNQIKTQYDNSGSL